jgi:hypothetical protein
VGRGRGRTERRECMFELKENELEMKMFRRFPAREPPISEPYFGPFPRLRPLT